MTTDSNNVKSGKGKGLIIVLAVIALLVLWGIRVYNNLVGKQETVETAVGNVQTAY